MKPLTHWYGGKTEMSKHIVPMLPEHKIYIEPFAGGAAVFFAKPLVKMNILNDKMDLLVNMYRQAKTHPEEFFHRIDCMAYAKTEHERTKVMLEKLDGTDMDLAVAFWYQCNSSFLFIPGNTFRRQSSTHRNEANHFVDYKEKIMDCIELLSRTTIENMDAIECIQKYDKPETLFYCDPPYVGTNLGSYEGYTQSDFDALLNCLSGIKGKFVLSCFENDSLSDYVTRFGWNQLRMDMSSSARNGGNGTGTRKTEVITCNYTIKNETPSQMVWE